MSMNYIEELVRRYPVLGKCSDSLYRAEKMLAECYEKDGKVLICGNGGSCADAQHIVGELMKGFLLQRELTYTQRESMKGNCPGISEKLLDQLQGTLPAIALTEETALNTAFCNDIAPEAVFAQQVLGYGRRGDVLLAISTSGNAVNVCNAACTAKSRGLSVLGLTGSNGGKLVQYADVCICVPEQQTYLVQELHLPVYHALCAQLEQRFFT